MTEVEARAHLAAYVSRETHETLAAFVEMVRVASETQNLISASTIPMIWNRHVLDSAQLLDLAPPSGEWLDIGSGAGFPGFIAAIMRQDRTTLVESRRLRAEFLSTVARDLRLAHVDVRHERVERITDCRPAVISARAVAPIAALFDAAAHLADEKTVWILPKGRSAASELAVAKETWQGTFVMHRSLTDPDAEIVVACDVRRRSARR